MKVTSDLIYRELPPTSPNTSRYGDRQYLDVLPIVKNCQSDFMENKA